MDRSICVALLTVSAERTPWPLAPKGKCPIGVRLRPRGGDAWKGCRLFDGHWTWLECRVKSDVGTGDAEHSDVIHSGGFHGEEANVAVLDTHGVKHVKNTIGATPRRSSLPGILLADLLGVEPSSAKTPAKKGLKIRSRTGDRGNVIDVLHAPNKTHGVTVRAKDACGIGRIESCRTKLVEDRRAEVPLALHGACLPIKPPRIGAQRADVTNMPRRAAFSVVTVNGQGKAVVKPCEPNGRRPDVNDKIATRIAIDVARQDDDRRAALSTVALEPAIASHLTAQAQRELDERDAALKAIRKAEHDPANAPRDVRIAKVGDLSEHERILNESLATARAAYVPRTIAEKLRADRMRAAKSATR